MQMFETGNHALSEQTSIASVTERVRALSLGHGAGAVHFLGDKPAFAGVEEAVTIVDGNDQKRVDAVSGGILSSASDGKRVVLGTDDGRVIAVGANGACETLATDAKRRWIDQVALGSDGSFAWSAGKTAFVKPPKGEAKSFDAPSSVGGLAFAPKGFRLAVAHYNGVSLWFPNMAAAPEFLEWKGSHLAVTFSPDGRFLVTSMHESALHGWRLADNKHMRMTGYPGRVRSLSWTVGGKFLATSGADSAILWPFSSKDGPMGKEPSMLAPMPSRVSTVAAHPRHEIVAVGFADGTILLVRIEDGAEILVRRNEGKPVTALGWNAKGTLLAFADEAGEGGLLPL